MHFNFNHFRTAAAAVTLIIAVPASAAPATLTFEGAGSNASFDNFYNGGTDSQGHSGFNYGVSFAPGAYASIDSDAGGAGSFANEPSPSTVLYFGDLGSIILNAKSGFTSSVSFYYSTADAAAAYVFDGLNLSGNLLGSVNLSAQFNTGCAGDPNNSFCNWTQASISFAGTGRSVFLTGIANHIAYDDVSFRDLNPAGGVPEPASWALLVAGFGLTGMALRRRSVSPALAA